MGAEVRILFTQIVDGARDIGQVFEQELHGRRNGGAVTGRPNPRLVVGAFRDAYGDVPGLLHGFPRPPEASAGSMRAG